MISAAHLDDVLMAGSQTGHTHSAHAGLCTGTQHTEHLYGRNTVGDLLGQLVLIFMEQTGGRTAIVQQFLNLLLHYIVVRAQDGGTAGLQEVVILVAVNIVELSTLGLGHYDGERIVKRQVVLHTAGNDLFRLGDHRLRLRALLVEVFFFILLQCSRADGINRLFDERVQLSGDLRCIKILRNCKSGIHNGRSSLKFNESSLTPRGVSHRSHKIHL